MRGLDDLGFGIALGPDTLMIGPQPGRGQTANSKPEPFMKEFSKNSLVSLTVAAKQYE